jgi:hypothetical protein
MEIEEFTENLDDRQKAVVMTLHNLIVENPGVVLKKKFNLPFYYRKSWICYFYIMKDGKVEWAFTRGNELSNQDVYLSARGRKQVKSKEFEEAKDIDIAKARMCLQEAILLDDHVPYNVKKD